MRVMHFVDVYRRIDTSLPLQFAWLYDTEGEWALRLPVSSEDSAEFVLLRQENDVSVYDAISPSTLPFVGQLMHAAQLQVLSVEIRTLFERAFYAVALFQQEAQTFEVTGRVGLLVALACRFACPITIDEELLVRSGVRLPPHTTLQHWLAEQQANVYQKLSLPPQHSPAFAQLETFMRQTPGNSLPAEQQQHIQAEIQQKLGPEQLKQLQHFYKNLTPEGRKISKEMWSRLGFSSPPIPQEVLRDDNGPDPKSE